MYDVGNLEDFHIYRFKYQPTSNFVAPAETCIVHFSTNSGSDFLGLGDHPVISLLGCKLSGELAMLLAPGLGIFFSLVN